MDWYPCEWAIWWAWLNLMGLVGFGSCGFTRTMEDNKGVPSGSCVTSCVIRGFRGREQTPLRVTSMYFLVLWSVSWDPRPLECKKPRTISVLHVSTDADVRSVHSVAWCSVYACLSVCACLDCNLFASCWSGGLPLFACYHAEIKAPSRAWEMETPPHSLSHSTHSVYPAQHFR